MLPESKNLQTIADNIRSLENQINALDVEIPSHAAADAGKILAVDSDGDLEWRNETPYIPPAYSSSEEVNTGQKWIDGKDIYEKVFIIPEDSEATSPTTKDIDITSLNVDNAISMNGITPKVGTTELNFPLSFYQSSTTYARTNISSDKTTLSHRLAFGGGIYGGAIVILQYTKSTETKSKKGGNKK